MKCRNQFLRFSLFAGFVATLAFSAASNELDSPPTPTNAITLDALVADVFERNPELSFYKAEIAAAKGERKTAGQFPNPEVSGQIGKKRVDDLSGAKLGDGTAWSVSVAQPFEFPGRLSLRKAIANRQIELAELGLAQFRATLAARTRTLGYGVLAAHEKAEAAREIADRFQTLRDVLVQRDTAGVTPLLDIRIIEAQAITVNRRASQLEQELQAALLELNQLRGASLGARLSIAKPATELRPSPSVETLLAAARTNNFELRIRQVELAQQGFKVDLARNDRWPAVTLSPYYSEEKANDAQQIYGVGVSVPLPLWNRNKGNIETAKARQQQAEASLSVSVREVERQVIEQAIVYETRTKEMARWRPEAQQQFRDAAELADRHYRMGAVPLTTYLEMQKEYLEALDTLLATQGEAIESRQQLELLTGTDLNSLFSTP